MDDYLMHYGVLNMKWGVRRYQNYDGTLTDEGRRRLATKVFTKATEKADKLESRKNRAHERAESLAPRYDSKANHQLGKSAKRSKVAVATQILGMNRLNTLSTYGAAASGVRGYKYSSRAAQLREKDLRATKKAERWIKSMEKSLSKISISDIDPSVLAAGSKYISMLTQ